MRTYLGPLALCQGADHALRHQIARPRLLKEDIWSSDWGKKGARHRVERPEPRAQPQRVTTGHIVTYVANHDATSAIANRTLKCGGILRGIKWRRHAHPDVVVVI